ncbi:Deoxycytidylate deaminase [Scedosporium apiospermum]|uniref:Deoxycytidylate deaminase n=1 Tax=Pseudallescheria apiosperma TaxID=563466 RepID=A0A084GCW7_PSEDA|nr:Deoxycytidylate deaminase [Scedosporium apiospermum]KEZ45179.1 Deoxycytidylate deaminase [Scedosporium apiospermum]
MLIGICGGICSGKKTVAQYLVDHHGFKHLYLEPPSQDTSQSTPSSTTTTSSSSDQKQQPLPLTHPSQPYTFPTVESLLDFVTKRWRSRFVTTNIHNESILDLLSRRPFFILVSVDSPLVIRHRRFQAQPHRLDLTLEQFVAQSDAHLYDPTTGLQPLISRASVRLLNTSESLAHLYATLGKIDLANPERLRPSWDSYFMSLASLAAQRSNCMKRRVGCVLVGREKRVISTGYNGTPRGLRNCAEGGCTRCNEANSSGVGLSTCLCIHAEENALLEAGRERIRDGAVLYCDTCPCLTCSIKICQVGISEVVYSQGYSMDTDTAAVFREAGVKLRQFSPPPNGLIHLERLDN